MTVCQEQPSRCRHIMPGIAHDDKLTDTVAQVKTQYVDALWSNAYGAHASKNDVSHASYGYEDEDELSTQHQAQGTKVLESDEADKVFAELSEEDSTNNSDGTAQDATKCDQNGSGNVDCGYPSDAPSPPSPKPEPTPSPKKPSDESWLKHVDQWMKHPFWGGLPRWAWVAIAIGVVIVIVIIIASAAGKHLKTKLKHLQIMSRSDQSFAGASGAARPERGVYPTAVTESAESPQTS